MNADCKGALRHLNISWKVFTHKGKPMSKKEVKAVLEYAIANGYYHTGLLSELEVDNIIKKINMTGNGNIFPVGCLIVIAILVIIGIISLINLIV